MNSKKIGLWHWQSDTRKEVANANEALEENSSSLSNTDGVESTFLFPDLQARAVVLIRKMTLRVSPLM